MRMKDAIAHFGSKTKLAMALEDCTPQAVSQWGEFVPRGRAYEIQAITKNKLKYKPPVQLKQAS